MSKGSMSKRSKEDEAQLREQHEKEHLLGRVFSAAPRTDASQMLGSRSKTCRHHAYDRVREAFA
jgi:hypothetical protein